MLVVDKYINQMLQILILLFAVLRKRAWNYGRLALVQKNETNTKWTQLFYGSVDEVAGVSDNDTNSLSSVESSFIDKGFCSWIIAVFKIRYMIFFFLAL